MADDDRVKIRDLPAGASFTSSTDQVAVAQGSVDNDTDVTRRITLKQLVSSTLSAGPGIKIENGTKISLDGSGGSAKVTVNELPPSNPEPTAGDLWWDTNTARLYIHTGNEWTVANPAGTGTTGGSPPGNGKNYDNEIAALEAAVEELKNADTAHANSPHNSGDGGGSGEGGSGVTEIVSLHAPYETWVATNPLTEGTWLVHLTGLENTKNNGQRVDEDTSLLLNAKKVVPAGKFLWFSINNADGKATRIYSQLTDTNTKPERVDPNWITDPDYEEIDGTADGDAGGNPARHLVGFGLKVTTGGGSSPSPGGGGGPTIKEIEWKADGSVPDIDLVSAVDDQVWMQRQQGVYEPGPHGDDGGPPGSPAFVPYDPVVPTWSSFANGGPTNYVSLDIGHTTKYKLIAWRSASKLHMCIGDVGRPFYRGVQGISPGTWSVFHYGSAGPGVSAEKFAALEAKVAALENKPAPPPATGSGLGLVASFTLHHSYYNGSKWWDLNTGDSQYKNSNPSAYRTSMVTEIGDSYTWQEGDVMVFQDLTLRSWDMRSAGRGSTAEGYIKNHVLTNNKSHTFTKDNRDKYYITQNNNKITLGQGPGRSEIYNFRIMVYRP